MNFDQIFGKLVTDAHIELSEQKSETVFLAIHDLDGIIAYYVLREVKKYFDFKLRAIELNVEDVFEIKESVRKGLPPIKQLNYTTEYYGLIGRNPVSEGLATNPAVMKAFSDFWSVMKAEALGKNVYIFNTVFEDIEKMTETEKEKFINWIKRKQM